MVLGEKIMAKGESSKGAQARDGKKFPIGMRVVAVDDDHICLAMLNKLLIQCQYQVTCFTDAIEALKMIKENKDEIDLVITDVHMPHIDGFQLLEIVGLELDLPVIMLSANDTKETVMKGVMHGACDYLIKPVRIEELSVIWKHVARRKPLEEFYEDAMNNDDVAIGENNDQRRQMDIHGDNSDKSTGKRSKDDADEDDFDDMESNEKSIKKKPRVVWSPELHKKFVDAVSDIGVDKAVPKSILEKMKMEDLTRENVASHLQKYRLYLKRLNADPNSFQGSFSSGSFSINLRSFQRFKNFHSHGRYRFVPRDSSLLLQSSMASNTLANLPSSAMSNVAPSQMTQISSGTGFNNAGTSNFMLTNSTMNYQMNQSGTRSYPVTTNSNYLAPFNNNPNYLSLSTLYPSLGRVPLTPFGYPMTNVPPISNLNSMVGPIFGASSSENGGSFTLETGVGQQQRISSFNTSWSLANASISTGNLNDINCSNFDSFFNNPINGYSAMMSGATGTGIISSTIGMSIASGDMGTGIASGDIGTGVVSGSMSGNVSGGMGFGPVNEGTETGNVSGGKGTDVACSNVGAIFGGSDMRTSIASSGMGINMDTGSVGRGIGTGPVSQGDAEFVGSFCAADSITDNNSSSSLHVVDEVSISGLDEFLATLQTSDGDGDSDGADSLPFINNGFFN